MRRLNLVVFTLFAIAVLLAIGCNDKNNNRRGRITPAQRSQPKPTTGNPVSVGKSEELTAEQITQKSTTLVERGTLVPENQVPEGTYELIRVWSSLRNGQEILAQEYPVAVDASNNTTIDGANLTEYRTKNPNLDLKVDFNIASRVELKGGNVNALAGFFYQPRRAEGAPKGKLTTRVVQDGYKNDKGNVFTRFQQMKSSKDVTEKNNVYTKAIEEGTANISFRLTTNPDGLIVSEETIGKTNGANRLLILVYKKITPAASTPAAPAAGSPPATPAAGSTPPAGTAPGANPPANSSPAGTTPAPLFSEPIPGDP